MGLVVAVRERAGRARTRRRCRVSADERRVGAELEPDRADDQRRRRSRARAPRGAASVALPGGDRSRAPPSPARRSRARPARRRGALRVLVDRERALGPLGAPFDVLVDVALEHRHAQPGQRPTRPARSRRAPKPMHVRQHHRREAGCRRRVERAQPHDARERGARRARSRTRARRHPPSDASGKQQQVVVLRIAERRPGEARERERAQRGRARSTAARRRTARRARARAKPRRCPRRRRRRRRRCRPRAPPARARRRRPARGRSRR